MERNRRDLGRRRLTPELDLIDNLYYRIQRRMPVSNIAAPDFAPLGMLEDWKVEHLR